MLTQIVCPKCQNPYTAEVHQIVDVGQEPELKMALLNGYLNVAVCPHCRTATQVATPLLYHDPEHELFMVYVPIELSMKQADQEKLIGQLVRRAMDNLPPEQRRGYMFQPQTIISLQTFMEKILETEGITPEMLARQRKQAELLQTLSTADKEVVDILLKERADEIDEGFFALLRASVDAAEQAGQDDRALKLINLQARLYRETEYGRRLDQQQRALHAFSRDARKEGLTPKLLLKHVLANRDDEMVVDALIMAGQQAFNYQFFAELSDKIEKRQKSGVESEEYVKLREHLLEIQEALQRRSQEILEGAQRTLQEILRAEDKAAAVRANLGHIDDAFMYVLSAN
ncbi:MAG: CpXC domain-containing protein, partial [Chloroflexi bacterium]|nr:CpXC domain-containing protein [Chloroflexota bacterium]